MSVEECRAYIWQGDTLGVLPVITVTAQSYCSLEECISSEGKFMESPCSRSYVGISGDTGR